MPYVKQTHCPHCECSLEGKQAANHIRWCMKNPAREMYVNKLHASRNSAPPSNQFIKAKAQGLEVPPGPMRGKPGTFAGKRHSEETLAKMSESARSSPHRRLCRSIRPYSCKDGSVVMLDSSWEEALAIRLDAIGIEWVRPDPVQYVGSDNKTHNYFPDFYLPKYDLYIDPKNPVAMAAQIDKVTILRELMPNLIFIETFEGCVNFTPS